MVSIGPFSQSSGFVQQMDKASDFSLGTKASGRLGPAGAGGGPLLAQATGELPLGNLAGGLWQLFSAAAQGLGRLAGHAVGVGGQILGMLFSSDTANADRLVEIIHRLAAMGVNISEDVTLSPLPNRRDMGVYALLPGNPTPQLLGIVKQGGEIILDRNILDILAAVVGAGGDVIPTPRGARGDEENRPHTPPFPGAGSGELPPGSRPEPRPRENFDPNAAGGFGAGSRPSSNSGTPPSPSGNPEGLGSNSANEIPHIPPGANVGLGETPQPMEWPESLQRPPAGSEMSPEAQNLVDKLNDAREQLRRDMAERQEEIDRLGDEIQQMEEARRQIAEDGRADREARDILRQLQEAIAGGGLGTALGGRLNDAGQIGELAEAVSGEVEQLKANGQESVALALLNRLFDRYGEFLQQGIGQAGSGTESTSAQREFNDAAGRIFNEMDISEISRRINPEVLALLLNPKEAIRGYTPDASPAFQRIADALLPGLLESEEDLARYIVSQNFVNSVSGLKNANALPLVAQEGHHLIVAEFGGGKSVNETFSHERGDDLIAAGMAKIARVVTEAGGEVLHPNGATAVIVLPPGVVEDTLARLDEVFRDLSIGTADRRDGGEVFRPGIAFYDTGPITDTSIEGLEAQFAEGRREIDAVKAERVAQGLYPERGADVFERYNPLIHTNVLPLEGFSGVPTTPTGARHEQNQVLRDGFSDLRYQIANMNPYEQQLLALRALEEQMMQAEGVVSGPIEAPRDADGRVPEGYVHVQGDMSKLSVLNNKLGWDVGDTAIGHLNAAIQAAAAAYPDVTFRKFGGDEWEAIGPRESAEAAVALIRQYLADVTISFPNPNNPSETWTLHGLGMQTGIVEIERDSPTGRASSEALEHAMSEDKEERGYTLDIRDEEGRPVQP